MNQYALHRWRLAAVLAIFSCAILRVSAESGFSAVAAIVQNRCLDCHSAPDPDGKLLMDSLAALLKGGESGPAIIPGKSAESLLVKMIEGTFEKDGKKKIMPPGKREKLSKEEITALRAWIDAGAKGPAENALIAKEFTVPKITPKVPPKPAVYSAACDPHQQIIALGRMGKVEILSARTQTVLRTLAGPEGSVNALAFSPDGKFLYAVGGTAGIRGAIKQWSVADWRETQHLHAHTDAIYALAVAPDGTHFATGSYDQKIKIWTASEAREVRTLSGHNGCIYGLAFRPDGKLLASASGDRTVKLWEVQSGARRDTLSQPLKEQYTVAFSPDGKRLAAGGVDNRIRVWEISAEARETTNPLLHSRFAHEGSILKLVFSADGKSLASAGDDKLVKLWDSGTVQERRVLEPQPDWAPAIAFLPNDKGLVAGRLDGSTGFYDVQSGSTLRPPRPEIARLEPRGVQRGMKSRMQIFGNFLETISGVRSKDGRVKAELARADEKVFVTLEPEANLPRGTYDLVFTGAQDAEAKVYIDNLPQLAEHESGSIQKIDSLPATVWGNHHQSGDKDLFEFTARAGETLVFDAAAKSIGSKADLVLSLSDGEGRVIATNNRFDKTGDPLLAHKFEKAGVYRLEVSELVLGGSAEHFYRVSIGAFPFITGFFPPIAQAGNLAKLELVGFNLAGETVSVTPANPPAQAVTLDAERFRWRGDLQVGVVERPVLTESEPNNFFSTASSAEAPGVIAGRIAAGDKEDWFRFTAKAGQRWILETAADRIGSPLDTKLEIRDAEGKAIPRTLLQAVRASAVTFRGIDSATVDCRVENWEEMELNQYLYLQGEVVRLFRAPQGPDSGFNFYALNGRRRNYFDTTASAHANAEPCYIVEPQPVGAKLTANGLPTFPVFFENDDDSERKLGTDSKVYFTAAKDGVYFARVTDTRAFSGDRFLYTLTMREARPDFKVNIDGMNPSVAKGSGQRFILNAERVDGFEGEIKVEVSGLPPGFTVSNPITIQEGHTTAFGTLFASTNAAESTTSKLTATAQINGATVTHDAGSLGKITVTDKSTLYVDLEPREITIAPGQSVPATIRIQRNGHNELVTFQVENLPHGIIVDNIGLNGVLIPKDQNEREIFLTAAKWVPETDRLCYAISNEAGRQTSRPVLIKVRKNPGQVAAR